jgi:hypothetical protein
MQWMSQVITRGVALYAKTLGEIFDWCAAID